MKATAARPLLVVAAVLASGVAESQSATMMAPAPLESALCLAGNPAHVFANSSIDATGAKWVLNFGSQSAGRPGFCIDEDHCAMVAAGCPGINAGCPGPAPRKPAPAPAPVALLAGIQSQNCTENPAFCGFNQVQLDDCDQALLLSNATVDTVCRNASAQLTPINGSTCTLHFQGLRILQQSIAKLAQLGLAKAEEVVLTGFSHGGTMALLHADRVHAMIKAVAPGLKRFAAIPADGVHPRSRWGVVDWCTGRLQAILIACALLTCHVRSGTGSPPSAAPLTAIPRGCAQTRWTSYTQAWPMSRTPLQRCQRAAGLGTQGASGSEPPSPPTCAPWQMHVSEHRGRCMYLNETLSEIKTPAFLVNQLASIFDTQCNLAGSIIDMGQGFAAILQLKCITGEGPWHECFQYSDKCSGGPRGQVLGVIKPFQQQLIDETASFTGSAGNGAFYHSCHR